MLYWLVKHNPTHSDLLQALIYAKWAYEAATRLTRDRLICPDFRRAALEDIVEKAPDTLRSIAQAAR